MIAEEPGLLDSSSYVLNWLTTFYPHVLFCLAVLTTVLLPNVGPVSRSLATEAISVFSTARGDV